MIKITVNEETIKKHKLLYLYWKFQVYIITCKNKIVNKFTCANQDRCKKWNYASV